MCCFMAATFPVRVAKPVICAFRLGQSGLSAPPPPALYGMYSSNVTP